MSQHIFSFLRLRIGDKLILSNYGADYDNEIYVIHARVTNINSDGVYVRQTTNGPEMKEHDACWLGVSHRATGRELSFKLYLGEDLSGGSIQAGQCLVFVMEGKPYVFPLTDIEVNPGGDCVAQDLTKL